INTPVGGIWNGEWASAFGGWLLSLATGGAGGVARSLSAFACSKPQSALNGFFENFVGKYCVRHGPGDLQASDEERKNRHRLLPGAVGPFLRKVAGQRRDDGFEAALIRLPDRERLPGNFGEQRRRGAAAAGVVAMCLSQVAADYILKVVARFEEPLLSLVLLRQRGGQRLEDEIVLDRKSVV